MLGVANKRSASHVLEHGLLCYGARSASACVNLCVGGETAAVMSKSVQE